MNSQERIFELLKEKIPEHYKLKHIVEDILDISSDSAYRRISGKKGLTLEEAEKICQKYRINIDEVINYNSNQSVLFSYNPIDLENQDNYFNYISQINKRMEDFLETSKNLEIIYTAQDIPIYHLFKYKDLALFRLFAWNNIAKTKKKSYNEMCNIIDQETLMAIHEKSNNLFAQIPTKEIWTELSVDRFLRMIEYYYFSGPFLNKEESLMLLENLIALIKEINLKAENGNKEITSKANYELYSCAVEIDSNVLLINSDNNYLAQVKLHIFNYMGSDNIVFCTELKKWVENLISQSILISGKSSIKERYQFFQTLNNKINKTIEKIKVTHI